MALDGSPSMTGGTAFILPVLPLFDFDGSEATTCLAGNHLLDFLSFTCALFLRIWDRFLFPCYFRLRWMVSVRSPCIAGRLVFWGTGSLLPLSCAVTFLAAVAVTVSARLWRRYSYFLLLVNIAWQLLYLLLTYCHESFSFAFRGPGCSTPH